MESAPIPEQEEVRLRALHALQLLDTSPEERFDRFSRIAARIFGTSTAFVSLVDRDRQFLKSRVGIDVCETPRDISICAHAIAKDELLVVPDTRLDKRFADNPLVLGEPFLRFYAGQPLRSIDGQCVGTFCIADQKPHTFSAEERVLLQELAGLVQEELRLADTIVVQDQLIAAQRELIEVQARVSREIREAARYVESSLPRPIDHPLSIDWVYLPSGTLGGDGFGYAEISPGRFSIYLLDVCGHGVPSALLAVILLNVLRSRSLPGVDFGRPADVLAALNAAFPMRKHAGRFFTLWYAVIDIASGLVTYGGAGHPPALVIDANTGSATRLTSEGIPVGCFPAAVYGQGTYQLRPSETLYIFSDGAFEIENEHGRNFSLPRLAGALADATREGAPIDSILHELRQYGGSVAFRDDVAILSARLTNGSRPAGSAA